MATEDDVWYGSLVRVEDPAGQGGDVELRRYCNVFVVRCTSLTLAPERVWQDAETAAGGAQPVLVQVTMPDGRTRGHRARRPSQRQACHDVSVHVYVGPGREPNVKATTKGVLQVTGCSSMAEVRVVVGVLRQTPGFDFAVGCRCFVDAILVNTKFALGWEVDRVLLWREIERRAEQADARDGWRATFNSKKKHVGVSVFCPSPGPTDNNSGIPCWEVGADGALATVAATVSSVLPLLRKEHRSRLRRRPAGPRHTFRVFRKQGKVVHVCSWPPELVATHRAFLELMRTLRPKVELRLGADALLAEAC